MCYLCFIDAPGHVVDQVLGEEAGVAGKFPIVVSTWPFLEAVRAAWKTVDSGGLSAVDAVIEGCSTCEELRCDGTGWDCMLLVW